MRVFTKSLCWTGQDIPALPWFVKAVRSRHIVAIMTMFVPADKLVTIP